MKLIFLYGAPAVGKLTVAQELSRITGYKIFHNHATIDLVKSLFDYKTTDFSHYRDKLRYEFIEIAAKKDINIIFTFCYAPILEDNQFINKIINIVKKYQCKIYFVHLSAERKVLEKRVKEESRKRYEKMNKISSLREQLKKYNNFPAISFVDSLKINNTKISPKKVASQIKKYYKL